MTKSIIWRWLIILAVLISWTVSIFPYKQRPFDQVFVKLAKNPDAQLTSLLAEAQTRTSPLFEAAKELEAKLATWYPVAGKADASNVDVVNELLKDTPAAPKAEDLAKLKAKAQNPDAALDTWLAKVAELALQPPLTPQRTLEDAAADHEVMLRNYISIYKRPTASNREVIELVHKRSQGKLRLGLDLRGGTEFHVAFDESLVKDRPVLEVRDEIIEIIRNRVDNSGVFEPEIKPIGPATISVKVPSVDPRDIAKIRHLLNISAKLEFHLVHPESDAFTSGAKPPESGYEF